jgi:hypothetical protein
MPLRPMNLFLRVAAAVVATAVAAAATADAAGAVGAGRRAAGVAVFGGDGGCAPSQRAQYLGTRPLKTFERHLGLEQAVLVDEVDGSFEGEYPTR